LSVIQTPRTFGRKPSFSPDRYRNPDNDPRGAYLVAPLTYLGVRPKLHYAWRGHVPPPGRHWRFTLERAEAADLDGRIHWPANGGTPRLKRYLAEEEEKEAPLDEDGLPRTLVERALRSMLHALAQEIVRTPDYLAQVEWRDLERLLGEVLSGLGFGVLVTRSGRDGGFDLELSCDEAGRRETYLVEIKHWAAPSRPGPGVLERFFEVVLSRRANGGLFLSSSGYSAPALAGRTEIARELVRLGNANKIVGLCQSYVSRGRGVWTPTRSLPTILFADTY